MNDIVKALRSVDHGSVEDCFLQSPLFEKAAIEIERLRAANDRIGSWMAAALDDPAVCKEMKDDIEVWLQGTTA